MPKVALTPEEDRRARLLDAYEDQLAYAAGIKNDVNVQNIKVLREQGKQQARTDAQLRSTLFEKACELAKTPPTRRQASKFSRSKGLAFNFINQARRELANV